ncbi:hypothetical protein NIES4072_01580 [Nostoc commune NIES-4072]|uniref:Uncharacterized protein n=1 Tax=Nostoc commune NIES-4072 TaxID=2005467 RepID=A0A2R5FDQ2_NOSCO|nr:hypothetical protein NIES4070_25240 [Nostoc commune HK-02]GBG16512.1 hypothetical protein NIES4072_01580 [Nostoc commune NIES-4072]
MISISQRPSLSVEYLFNKAFKLNSVLYSDDNYTPILLQLNTFFTIYLFQSDVSSIVRSRIFKSKPSRQQIMS